MISPLRPMAGRERCCSSRASSVDAGGARWISPPRPALWAGDARIPLRRRGALCDRLYDAARGRLRRLNGQIASSISRCRHIILASLRGRRAALARALHDAGCRENVAMIRLLGSHLASGPSLIMSARNGHTPSYTLHVLISPARLRFRPTAAENFFAASSIAWSYASFWPLSVFRRIYFPISKNYFGLLLLRFFLLSCFLLNFSATLLDFTLFLIFLYEPPYYI